MSQLSVSDQQMLEQLNEDIRKLTLENKEAFISRIQLEGDKIKLENLLSNNLRRRKEELVQVIVLFVYVLIIIYFVLFSSQSSKRVHLTSL